MSKKIEEYKIDRQFVLYHDNGQATILTLKEIKGDDAYFFDSETRQAVSLSVKYVNKWLKDEDMLPFVDDEDKEPTRAAMRDKMQAILKKHGIRMKISGCGCCGSPGVIMEYKGETIVDSTYFNFEMKEDENG